MSTMMRRRNRRGGGVGAWRGLACLLVVMTATLPALSDDPVVPACFDELAAFAAEHDLDFDPDRVGFAARWIGAGHEIRRVPGLVARLPVASCGATLAVDLGVDCKVVKSRGEGACKRTFPLTFH